MTVRAGARVLLASALAMLIETSCSHAPAPATSPESGKVITKIHTTDGTLYVTSRYAVVDSFVVIEEILRDPKYYPEPNEPHIYQKPEAVKEPAKELVLPLRIPIKQVQSIEPWRQSHKTRNGILLGASAVLVFLIIAASAAVGDTWVGY